ncbi:MAG TPA: hypothetical protein VG329_04900 [Candidatus Dormibacteraeota bacterium]|nr:hypothetical protein [Candidatus Dormibacteraeota bacterium]
MARIDTAYRRLGLASPDALALGLQPSTLSFGLAGLLAAGAALALSLLQAGFQRLPQLLR